MPGKHLYEYAVIRVVPRVEREEFLNAGVVLYCREEQFLALKYILNEPRILSCCADLDLDELQENFKSFDRICAGNQLSGPIGKLDQASRFRWLTATRSTVLQSSKVHPGFTTDAALTIEKLFNQLVA